jgi:hypothetical protein
MTSRLNYMAAAPEIMQSMFALDTGRPAAGF